MKFFIIIFLSITLVGLQKVPFTENYQAKKIYDNEKRIIVYGATPSGIVAAIAAARMGTEVLILEPTDHIGGIITNGLTIADLIKRNAFGGIYEEYLQRIKRYYVDKYGPNSEQVLLCKEGEQPEPHVADTVFNQMLREQTRIKVVFNKVVKKVNKNGNKLYSILAGNVGSNNSNNEYRASVFIDASYEGDLLALAGAKYVVGREARNEYNEPQAGVIYSRFGKDEYLPGSTGEADRAIQAFCFRLSMTQDPNNRVPIDKPDNYNRNEYLHYLKDIKEGRLAPMLPSHLVNRNKLMQPVQLWRKPNNKVEVNSEHVEPTVGAPRESSDLAEENFEYPEATHEERRIIIKRYWDYQIGIFWFLQNDAEVPEVYRKEAAKWGFCKDEFVTNSNKPRQIYVRETRRMKGEYFLTQHDADVRPEIGRPAYQDKSIGICEYPFDSHGCHKYDEKYPFTREGYFYIRHEPFQIPYGVIVPELVDGLLVTCSNSSSHVAYQAMREEPVYMSLGEVAGVAASISIQHNTTLREIPIRKLQMKLIQNRNILTYLEDVGNLDSNLTAIQFLATYGIQKGFAFKPDFPVSEKEAFELLTNLKRNVAYPLNLPKVPKEGLLSRQTVNSWIGKKKIGSSLIAPVTKRDLAVLVYRNLYR